MASNSKLHAVMFPWLAFGHIIPFFELSKFIAQKGHKISFVSTPRNIDRLPKIPSHLVSNITLVKISLPKVEGLPESAEATMDIRNEDMDHLKKAYDGMETEMTRFLEESRPDWIIYDFAHVRMEIPKNHDDGTYTKNSVSDSIKLVMDENEGKTFRERTKEMSEVFGDKKLHDRYIQNFIQYLESS
ncbi:unnamed protein product [Fraxinus pennsylvanica]|uniref:Uncharacterized protein n=1 Tax=Fraxinus pennsylvanica TaxID=56036 RepID=A0AAD1ZAF8_9LAMI|nr:unnamed protein product [Fraxinus pennsylvanica]